MHARRGRRRAQLPEDGPAVQEAVPGRLRRRPLLSPSPLRDRVARRAARWRAAADRRTRSDLAEDGARGLRQHGREPPGCEGEEGRDWGARRCDLGRRRDRRQPRPAEHRAASRLPGGDHARRERDRDLHVRRPGPAAPGSGAARPPRQPPAARRRARRWRRSSSLAPRSAMRGSLVAHGWPLPPVKLCFLTDQGGESATTNAFVKTDNIPPGTSTTCNMFVTRRGRGKSAIAQQYLYAHELAHCAERDLQLEGRVPEGPALGPGGTQLARPRHDPRRARRRRGRRGPALEVVV